MLVGSRRGQIPPVVGHVDGDLRSAFHETPHDPGEPGLETDVHPKLPPRGAEHRPVLGRIEFSQFVQHREKTGQDGFERDALAERHQVHLAILVQDDAIRGKEEHGVVFVPVLLAGRSHQHVRAGLSAEAFQPFQITGVPRDPARNGRFGPDDQIGIFLRGVERQPGVGVHDLPLVVVVPLLVLVDVPLQDGHRHGFPAG